MFLMMFLILCKQVVGPIADNIDYLMGIYHPTPDREFIKTPYEGLRDIADESR